MCLLDDLPYLLEALQGEQAVAEVLKWADIIRGEAQAFAMRLRGLLILPQRGVHVAQIGMCSGVSPVALDLLLIRLCRFLQFPGYILIVVSGDGQLFPLAGMFP